ncbi:hypothetical protein KNT78_gp047 [Shigella phage phi25-307]|uniref:Uncharacterized protein n=1 Tax=Shigella phage phi25-307 TaxID=2340715 RepID=A0A386K4I8_9CAUD|nr:hypothetical protein KNT78_gp047 [Shigella phage phi25-307]AYD79289.1 hypothetical protein FFEPELFE_00047 [Shigella phage phi25-307]
MNDIDFAKAYKFVATLLGPDAPTKLEVLNSIPTSLVRDAEIWTWNDSVVRDDLYVLMNDMMVKKAEPVAPMVTITVEEYNRLQAIEELLWNIECDLPSGLESWIDYEELNKLRG